MTVLDHLEPTDSTAVLQSLGFQQLGDPGKLKVWALGRNGVRHIVMRCRESRRGHLPAGIEQLFFSLFRQQINQWKPDIVYGYGGLLLECAMFAEARRRGIRTAFYLANAEYRDPMPFRDVDAIFTPSKALASHYAQSLGLDPVPIGSFTRQGVHESAGILDGRDRITMVNPLPEKGVAYLLAIAEACLERMPEARFLVVESRGTKRSVTAQFGERLANLPNLEFVPHQQGIEDILRRTRVLLFPALWFEAAARTLLEAQSHGIPVLASSHGGNAEQLNGGGFLFDVGTPSAEECRRLPEAQRVAPWLDRLERLLKNDDEWQAASSRALAAVQSHDIPRLAQGLADALRGDKGATSSGP